MPMIRVELFPGRTSTQKAAFAKAVTEAFVATCGGTPQSVQIVFQDVDRGDWAIGGTLASETATAGSAGKSS